ncbi:small ribosomal subunit protein uS9m-like [Corticium candelabrum]|uniref:small ribosomal subunit protein uS9m-like n=1 Tax=Corticium candelabrum TaxID=121492 RepID=UPI002E26941D|nr:small ribosomal subunit protein uS9m-like [Corticium candelabrum]
MASLRAVHFSTTAKLGPLCSFLRTTLRVTRTLSSENQVASESKTNDDVSSSQNLSVTLEQRMSADLEKAATSFLKSKIKTHYQSMARVAKMMNRHPDTFTDRDLEEAIKYLLPTSLFAQDARPTMKHPFEIYHSHLLEADDFTEDGKPKAAAFFTGAQEYFDTLYAIYEQEEQVKRLTNEQKHGGGNLMHLSHTDANSGQEIVGDENSAAADENSAAADENSAAADENSAAADENSAAADENSAAADENSPAADENSAAADENSAAADENSAAADLTRHEEGQFATLGSAINQQDVSSRWLKKDEMSLKLATELSDSQYEVIIGRLQGMLDMPYLAATKDFLMGFRKDVVPNVHYGKELKLDASGRAYSTGHRKCSVAQVWLRQGSGVVKVNRCLLFNYFTKMDDRQQVMYPFLVTDTIGNFDVTCSVSGGGTTGQAGAIRHGISKALTCFSDTYGPLLEGAGLLTRDPRMVERKKPGQKKARKKFQWVKR